MDLSVFNECKNLSECARLLFNNDNYLSRNKVKEILNECGVDDWKLWFKNKAITYCKHCGKELTNKRAQFCSQSCAASYNNTKRIIKHYCKNCGVELNSNNKFCSNKCQKDYENRVLVQKWLVGQHIGCDKNGEISAFVKNYLLTLHGYKCEVCGFDKKNPYTENTILEIHHIDGDCYNNNLTNLQVLCPNCHAMTENYGRRNTKSTRKKRYKNT